jgi:hypothetical protein
MFGCCCLRRRRRRAAAAAADSASTMTTLEDYLGGPVFVALRADLCALGVDEVAELVELEASEVDAQAAKLKPVKARTFRRKVEIAAQQ